MFSKNFPLQKTLGWLRCEGRMPENLPKPWGFSWWFTIVLSVNKSPLTNLVFLKSQMKLKLLHPGRLTWNLQITHLERKMIFQTSMIMFHVNLQGCTKRLWGYGSVYWTMSPKNWNRYLAGYPRRWNVGWQTVYSKQKQCQAHYNSLKITSSWPLILSLSIYTFIIYSIIKVPSSRETIRTYPPRSTLHWIPTNQPFPRSEFRLVGSGSTSGLGSNFGSRAKVVGEHPKKPTWPEPLGSRPATIFKNGGNSFWKMIIKPYL